MSPKSPTLSICIGTFNRADYIGQTLDSIVEQLTDDCEIVIYDNASTDNTEDVIRDYARRFRQIRHAKQQSNCGIDANYDCAVHLASGTYCWLFTDDDMMMPGAVARVLEAIRLDFALILVDLEIRNVTMSKVLLPRWINMPSDRIYGPLEIDRLFTEIGGKLSNMCNVIIKREVWLQREREKFYGCLTIQAAVILQRPLPGHTLLISEPLIRYRFGNVQSWFSMVTEFMLSKWPTTLESMAISDAARANVVGAQPWRNTGWLLFLRGVGWYSFSDYRRWISPRLTSPYRRVVAAIIALLPAMLVNTIFTIYYGLRADRGQLFGITMARSRFGFPYWWRSKLGLPMRGD